MGFFAVLERPSQPPFTVEKLDVNLWCLPGLTGREVFWCDVGILVDVDQDAQKHLSFDLGLPFETTADGLTDLARTVARDETARLVFGEKVESRSTATGYRELTLTEEEETFCLAEIAHEPCMKEKESDGIFSLWEIGPAVDVSQVNHPIYMRIRFAVRSLGRLWKWRKSKLRRHGAVVDLRVCDLRGAFDVPASQNYPDKIVNIRELNCFVIVPIQYPIKTVSPELKYMRLLEGRRWESYLNRATDFWRKGKLQVVFVRGEEVGKGNEFRSFLGLGSKGRSSLLLWAGMFVAALCLAALLIPLSLLENSIGYKILDKTTGVLSQFSSYVYSVVGLSVLIWLGRGIFVKKWWFSVPRWVRVMYRRIENWIYRTRADL